MRTKLVCGTGGLTLSTSTQDIPGLTYTFTADANCQYEVVAQMIVSMISGNTGSDRQLDLSIRDGDSILSMFLDNHYTFSDYQMSSVSGTWVGHGHGTLSAGTHTIKVTTQAGDSGNAAIYYGVWGGHDPVMFIKEYQTNSL